MGDMWLVNTRKRMAPASLLSGVWENVKLSRILGFMSLGLSYQIYILFSLYIFAQLLKLPHSKP